MAEPHLPGLSKCFAFYSPWKIFCFLSRDSRSNRNTVRGGHMAFELGKARLIIATVTFLNPQNFSPSLPADCGFSKFPCRQLSIRRLNPSLGCATLPVYLAHIYRRFREVKKATLVRGYQACLHGANFCGRR